MPPKLLDDVLAPAKMLLCYATGGAKLAKRLQIQQGRRRDQKGRAHVKGKLGSI